MRIEIICTGDEVLTGKTINTNYAFMSERLEEAGLAVRWGTIVGDDRDSLLEAFQLASQRADAVIVNGGLGPTVDDLSQEIAARAAGVALVLNEEWLARMEGFFTRRARIMPPNNRKQAMLPATAELIDNPIGTACGFALEIGRARFFFTPGVPREMRRMVAEQVIPRLLARSGAQGVIHLKRFHSYGLGESHVDTLLAGVEALAPDGSVKLGFRAHFPQLETKLATRGVDRADVAAKLAPIEAEVRRRLGNFILCEDDETLEGVVLAGLVRRDATLAVVESFTGGQIAARIAPLPGAERVLRRAVVSRDLGELGIALGIDGLAGQQIDLALAEQLALAAQRRTGATIALAALVEPEQTGQPDSGGGIHIGIAAPDGTSSRRARLMGGADWLRLGGVEMSLDCLRRHLLGLPLAERTDFEKA